MGVRRRVITGREGVVIEDDRGLAWLCPIGSDRYVASVHGYASEALVRDMLHWVEDEFSDKLVWCASDLSELKGLDARTRDVATEWAKRRATMPRMVILFRSKLTEMTLTLFQLFTRHPLEVFSDAAKFEEAVKKVVPMYRRRSEGELRAKD